MESEKKIRQYLLVNLPETESEEIDLRVISDENFADELTHAEDNLMEDFLDEELSEAEIKLFHENFLISEERIERLKQISLLRIYAQNETKESAIETEIAESEGFFDKLSKVFALTQRPGLAVLTVLLVILSGFIVWKVAFNKPETEIARLEKEAIELNKQDLSNLDEFKDLANLSIFPGKTRSGDEENNLKVEKSTENILLRLALPSDLSDTNDFNLKITGNQNETISLKEIRVYDNKNGKEIRLLIPKSALKKGEYQIEVVPENNDKYPLNYTFKVN
jgi:hypothetical protein